MLGLEKIHKKRLVCIIICLPSVSQYIKIKMSQYIKIKIKQGYQQSKYNKGILLSQFKIHNGQNLYNFFFPFSSIFLNAFEVLIRHILVDIFFRFDFQ